MLEQLLQLDTELFLHLNNLGSTTWDAFWMFYTTKFYWIPLYAVLLFLIFKMPNPKIFILTVVVIFLMVLFTDQVTNLFKKVLVMRLRPCHDPALEGLVRLVKPFCGGEYGYFSGHASNSMAVAVFSGLMLRYRYKYLIFIMLFWAALMGYSRIYIGVHYPLDVVSGMVFGALSGFLFYKLDKYLQNRFRMR
ncbi:phosphatase PAP2 family protein [Hanstruepera neustonica]|uniref:Phosphatase PAP2 family protein n=1 Tax=Hanstruepera neustonica TaxID=1445657 RepID=A0A2K1DVY8_9FLAO|nr:phosphatase PAP2 family protein [Hanstruepera neustonica]PNQ72139.1 phosphatase PAP2 family protein [Hanstruepera neustonica]